MQRQGIVSHLKAKARHSSAGHSTAMARRRAIRQGDTRQKQCGVLTSNARQGEAQQRQGDVRRVVAAHWRRHGTSKPGSVRHGRATAQHITEPLSTAMAWQGIATQGFAARRHGGTMFRKAMLRQCSLSQTKAVSRQRRCAGWQGIATARRLDARRRTAKAWRNVAQRCSATAIGGWANG